MNNLPDEAQAIVEAQGWSDTTLLDLCLTYIGNQDDDPAFVDFLRVTAAADQNDTHKWTPPMRAFLRAEWANYRAMLREAAQKGSTAPLAPTWGTAFDSIQQMPDDVLNEITSGYAANLRPTVQAFAGWHADTPLPEGDE